MSRQARHVLDACSLINLLASGEGPAILRSLRGSTLLPVATAREVLYLDIADAPRQVVDVSAVAKQFGLIVDEPLVGDERDSYVDLAGAVDDGEAMALCLAKARAAVLLTDDRRATRKANELGVGVLSTPALVNHWATNQEVSAERVVEVVRRIATHARFTPPERDPKTAWWSRLLRQSRP